MSRKPRNSAAAARKKGPVYDRVFQAGKPDVTLRNSDIGGPITGKSRMDRDYAYATGAGPNAAGLSRLDVERARSRHEYMTNEFAARAKQIRVAYTVGSGLRPHIKGDHELQRLWDSFVLNADPRGTLDYYGLQALAFSEELEGGEVFALPRFRRPEDGLEVRLQVQIVEGEYVPLARTGDMPENAIAGVELDKLERPIAYWLYDRHPHESVWTGVAIPAVKRYDASRVFHVFEPVRAGQLRGNTAIARALSRIRAVEKYERADLNRKETAALLGVAVKLPSADDDVSDTLGLGADEREFGQPYAMAPLEPGAIFGLPPGADVSVVNPNDSSTGYKDAWQTRYFGIATGLGVPYFLLTGDFSAVEERSLRFAMMDFFRGVRADRKRLNHQLNRRVWGAFLDAAEQAGWQPANGRSRKDYEIVEWIGEPLPHIHPVQEVIAQTNAVRAGTKTLGQVLQESGSDLETFLAEKKAENDALDAAGVILDSDPRKMTRAGGYQAP